MNTQNWITIASLVVGIFGTLYGYIQSRTLRLYDDSFRDLFQRVGHLEQNAVQRTELNRIEDKIMEKFSSVESKLDAAILARRIQDKG